MSTARVVVRLKPKSSAADEAIQSVDTSTKATILIKKGESEEGLYQFSFTKVLVEATQEEVYEVCGRDLVQSALQGYNGTIMAYGQTGSGKTFTMTGGDAELVSGKSKGLVPRSLQQVFRVVKSGSLLHWRVRLSYLEIYNDSLRDLLQPETSSTELSILDSKGNISIRNLTYVDCTCQQDAEKALSQGLANRQMASHILNSDSSRSHTIVSLWLDMVDKEGTALSSKLNLVDLAGSERFAKTGTQGTTAKEAVHINKSLTFLEQTVMALARRRQYVPFRSSKLTHFLKDSIGGNCKTLLIACAWSDRMMQVAENAQRNAGGLSAVHGNLFKLDPVMQHYLESMTAAAVAREKAQMYAEFARQREMQAAGLGESELEELETLRLRVCELEMRGTDEIAGQQIADEERLREIELLRRRVKEMEEEVASAAAEGAPRANFSKADATAETGLNDNSSSIPAGDGAVCVVAANSGLGGAAGPPHELVTARVENEHENLPCRTDTPRKEQSAVGSSGMARQAAEDASAHDNDVGHLVMDSPAQTEDAQDLPINYSSDPDDGSGIDSHSFGARAVDAAGNRVREYSEVQSQLSLPKAWSPPSEVQSQRTHSGLSTWDSEFGAFQRGLVNERRQKKKGFISRLFGKKEQEHELFAQPSLPGVAEEEAATPNIVILNSLNHNQLLELLKARPLRRSGLAGEVQKNENWEPITPELLTDKAAPNSSIKSSADSTGQAADI